MKKQFLFLFYSTALIIQLHAQSRLTQSGPLPTHELVQKPLMYYDIMRTQYPSWVRDYRSNQNQVWSKLNMVINQRDGNGKLVNLSYFSYDSVANKWNTQTIHLYQYQTTGNNITSEKREGWFFNGTEVSRYISDYTFTFQGNSLVKSVQSTSRSNYTQESEIFYTYDNENKVIHDSNMMSFNGSQFYSISDYYYLNNKCVKLVNKVGNDTVRLSNFVYASNQLSTYEIYTYDAQLGKFLLEKEDYTYDGMGRMHEALIYSAYGNNPVTNKYIHGYNPEGKLAWMSRYQKNNTTDSWRKEDSIVITLKNGEPDTSYGYLSANGTNWNNWPSLRYTFNNTLTGINDGTTNRLSFKVYPNPATYHLNIQLEQHDALKQVSVVDLLGRVLLTATQLKPISLTHLTPGTYFVIVETEQGKGTQKIVITE